MSEHYKNNVLETLTFYKIGEHIVGTDDTTGQEHVIAILSRDREGDHYTSMIQVVDDQYQTNPLGIR